MADRKLTRENDGTAAADLSPALRALFGTSDILSTAEVQDAMRSALADATAILSMTDAEAIRLLTPLAACVPTVCDPFALFLKPMHPALRVLSLADAAAGARLADFLLVDKKLAECFEQDIVQRYAEDPGAVPDWKAALSPGGDALFDRLVSRYAAIASAWLAPGLQQAAPLQYDAGDAFDGRLDYRLQPAELPASSFGMLLPSRESGRMAALPWWCRTLSVAASFGVLTPQEWEDNVEEEEQRKCVWRSAFGGHTAFVVWAVFGALRGHDGSCANIRQAANAATAGRRESLADFLRSVGEEYSSITAEQVIAALLAGWDDRAAFLRNELFAAKLADK